MAADTPALWDGTGQMGTAIFKAYNQDHEIITLNRNPLDCENFDQAAAVATDENPALVFTTVIA